MFSGYYDPQDAYNANHDKWLRIGCRMWQKRLNQWHVCPNDFN